MVFRQIPNFTETQLGIECEDLFSLFSQLNKVSDLFLFSFFLPLIYLQLYISVFLLVIFCSFQFYKFRRAMNTLNHSESFEVVTREAYVAITK